MSNEQELNQRLVRLEEMFSHQEQLVTQLDQVILDLRNELDAVKQRMGEQTGRLQWLIDNAPAEPRTLEDEKPPHY